MVASPFQVGRPHTDDRVAALYHVGVLRDIEGHASPLTSVGRGELGGVAVPVVAVELHDDAAIRQEGIHAELAADDVLRRVGNTETVEDGIPGLLDVVRLHALLHGVHGDKHGVTVRVSVAARERAIGNVVGFAPRRRPTEGFAAHLTDMFRLVAALPNVGAFPRAETGLVAVGREHLAAHLARAVVSLASIDMAAFLGAAGLVGASHRRPEHLAADSARLFRQARGDALALARAVFGRVQAIVLGIEHGSAYLAYPFRSCLALGACRTGSVPTSLRTVVPARLDAAWLDTKGSAAVGACSVHTGIIAYLMRLVKP